ncbi:MAG TPA: threonine synthase [Candidatus Dormibacteraeota bacterium]|nr:threonine synthase [Candidatus Dormibacteraeota bacterium]
MPSRIRSLVCRECGTEIPVQPTHVCDLCFGPLDVRYDYEEVSRRVSRESIERGPASIWRYRDLLPVDLDDDVPPVTLGEGFTPLVHAPNLGEVLGLRNLYLKNDTMNPTNSFKDRVVSVAVSWARRNGFTTIACASTGNLANSVAAYAARAGMPAFVFIPSNLEAAKVSTTAVFRPTMVRIDGNYDDVNRLCSELVDIFPWAFCNINVRPFYSEGSKTLTYETAEQLGWRLPDEIVIPIASGCQFVKHNKAARELLDLELVDGTAGGGAMPRFTGAQAAGCAPVATAFKRGETHIVPVKPDTIAKSIAIGNPSDGSYVVQIARATGGVVEDVTEEEILEGIELLARTEGIFTETAGGVTVAVLAKLARAGRWRGDETIAAYITGHGLKTAEVLTGRSTLDEPIAPTVRAFRERFAERSAQPGSASAGVEAAATR